MDQDWSHKDRRNVKQETENSNNPIDQQNEVSKKSSSISLEVPIKQSKTEMINKNFVKKSDKVILLRNLIK